MPEVAMEFKAIVLAAGRGSRMVDLTSQMPKCLLPIGGLPMLWYPLRQLQDAGFKQALVVISEHMQNYRSDILNLPQLHSLDINIDIFEIPGPDDLGTADTLRLLDADCKHGLRLSHLLVVSCDLVTACPLRSLLYLHRLEGGAFCALFAAPSIDTDLATVTVPGPKSRHKPERDLVALAEHGRRLCLLASEADFEETVAVRLSLLNRYPRLVVRSDLLDAHLYLLAPGQLGLLADDRLTSFKGEVVPLLISNQFRSAPSAADKSVGQPEPVADFSIAQRLAELAGYADLTPDAARRPDACFALTTDALTWRANTTVAWLAANRAATRLWEVLPQPRPPRLHPQAVIPATKVQVSAFSVVGACSTLSEKTTLQHTVVGRHCSLGRRVRLTDCVIMDHVTVHDDVTLDNCVLMSNSTVEERVHMKDCLVGCKQVVESGSSKSSEIVSQQGSNMEVY